jgi:hypothetical protein
VKIFAVRISTVAIIVAENEEEAADIAVEEEHSILTDETCEHDAPEVVASEADLTRHGWDGECIPYGGDGNTRLKNLFALVEPEPVRCDKTIDMFAPTSVKEPA